MRRLDDEQCAAITELVLRYPACDLADHLADVIPETMYRRTWLHGEVVHVPVVELWEETDVDLAVLAVYFYPGGAVGLLAALEGED